MSLISWSWTVDKLWYLSLLFHFVAALVYVGKYSVGSETEELSPVW